MTTTYVSPLLANLQTANTWAALQTFNSGIALAGIADPASPTAGQLWLSTTTSNVLKYADNAATPATHQIGALDIAQSYTAVQTFGNNLSFGGAVLNVTSLVTGHILQYNGTNWVNVTPASGLSISSPNSTLTIGTSGGNPTADIALGHANTWTSVQTFPAASITNSVLAGPLVTGLTGTNGLSASGSGVGAYSYSLVLNGTTLSLGVSGLSLNLANVNTWTGAQTFSATAAFTNASPFSMTNAQTLTVALTAQTVGATTLTIPNFAGASDTFVFITLAQTLSNKTLSSPTLSGTVSGTPTWSSGQTFPSVTVGAGGSIILSGTFNQTIAWTVPAAARTLTIPDPGASDTFAFLAATQTFTNKTISGASNTLSSIANSSLSGPLVTGLSTASGAGITLTGSGSGVGAYAYTPSISGNLVIGAFGVTFTAIADASTSGKIFLSSTTANVLKYYDTQATPVLHQLVVLDIAQTFSALQTFGAGITGTGNTGALTAGTGILGTTNTWTALQTFGNNISIGGATFNVVSLVSGHYIFYNGTNWVNVSPITGTTLTETAGQLALNLGNANTWTAAQTFSATAAFTNTSPFTVANAQTLTVSVAAQTIGAATLTIPNFAGVNDTLAFITLAQTLSNKTLASPVLSGTATGTYTFGGTPTVSSTLAFTNASPFSVANAQTLTISVTAQTIGAATLTIPNFAGVADTLAFVTLAQTLSNKTLASPAFSGTSSGTYTLGGTITINAFTLGGAISGAGNNFTGIGFLQFNAAIADSASALKFFPSSTTTNTLKYYDASSGLHQLAVLDIAQSFTALQTFGNSISIGGVQFNVTSLVTGQLLQYNGTNWVNFFAVTNFTANGTYTTPSGAKALYVVCVGGGGGGGGGATNTGGGGGAGGAGETSSVLVLNPSASYTVTIGGGGSSGAAGAGGGLGGDTSFGSIIAKGGTGGSGGSAAATSGVAGAGGGGSKGGSGFQSGGAGGAGGGTTGAAGTAGTGDTYAGGGGGGGSSGVAGGLNAGFAGGAGGLSTGASTASTVGSGGASGGSTSAGGGGGGGGGNSQMATGGAGGNGGAGSGVTGGNGFPGSSPTANTGAGGGGGGGGGQGGAGGTGGVGGAGSAGLCIVVALF